jgi:putative ABC transport system permease protein
LPENAFQVIPWKDLADFFNKTEALFSKQVEVMKIIIGLIIVLTISNTLTMSVLERTTEIGTSLAVGVRSGTVMRLFIIEGVLIGALGGLIGVILGYLLAMLISTIGIPMPAAPGMAHGYVAQIAVTPGLVLDGVVLALVTTLLASAFPAWKAGRMNIVDALRYSQ